MNIQNGWRDLTRTFGTWWMNHYQWRHNSGVSNHQPHHCLLSRLFRRRSKKTSKLRVTGLCAGNSPVTGEFPAQMASNSENVSIWWRHHDHNNSYPNGPVLAQSLVHFSGMFGNSEHIIGTRVMQLAKQLPLKLKTLSLFKNSFSSFPSERCGSSFKSIVSKLIIQNT